MTNPNEVETGLSQCHPGPLEPVDATPTQAPDIRVEVEPDPRGVSVGVWQGSHCIYSGAHPLPAAPGVSTVEDAQDEQPYCYALETRGHHGDQQDVLLDVEYNGTDSFSGGRTGGIPLYRRPAPAAGDALDSLDAVDVDWQLLRETAMLVRDRFSAALSIAYASSDATRSAIRRAHETHEALLAMLDAAIAAQRKGGA